MKDADIPDGINFEDMDSSEQIIERAGLSIVYAGKTLKPLQTRHGLIFMESRYLAPISDVLDVMELYERATPGGEPYIVAKAGFLLQAVIMPNDIITDQFVHGVQDLARQCAAALVKKKEKRKREAIIDPQYAFNVDSKTGEVIEPESEVTHE